MLRPSLRLLLFQQMLRLEFARYDYKLTGTISTKYFALSIVNSPDMRPLG
jgi:hypothetical protein